MRSLRPTFVLLVLWLAGCGDDPSDPTLDAGGTDAVVVCTQDEDCDDGSDEIGCREGTRFTCADGTKIAGMEACDGNEDCDDGSDEEGCPEGTHFTCGDGAKIGVQDVCDDYEDCDDGSDESDCSGYAQRVCQ